MDQQYDVIVVGAGGSGLAAACAAAQQGGRVLVLEKRPVPGGTTGISVGSYTAAGTRLQREAEIADNPADHAVDAARFAPFDLEARNNGELREFFLGEASRTLDWLEELGLVFQGPHPEPPNRVPRMHHVVPCGKAYVTMLVMALQRWDARLVPNATVEQLLRDGAGRVVGVRAVVDGSHAEYLAARGVILAAGDYANNPPLIARYKGEGFRHVAGVNPHATGDGQRLASDVGAKLLNMDVTYGPELRFVPNSSDPFAQWLPGDSWWSSLLGAVSRFLPGFVVQEMVRRLAVTWQKPESALFQDGAILVNREGARFVNEKNSPDREIACAEQPEQEAFVLLDSRLTKRYSAWPHFISTAPEIAYAYVSDYQRLRPDLTTTGMSLEDLCDRRGLDPEKLEASVAGYNRYVAGQQSDPFRRTGDRHPLEGGPWVLLGPVKAFFTTTEGGAAVNRRLQVLDEEDVPIAGLYACGQTGLGGQILWGHGLHIAWAMTSGRLAGQSVMADA